jgi:group I intron endonuclease
MSIKKGKIYKITNKENGLIYIGCTINSLEKRFYEHLYRCFKTDYKSKLYNSIKKYGVDNFIIELIEECDLNVIYETEKKYIKELDSYHNGLNSTFGGEGCLGYVHSSEMKIKISEAIKNGNSHKGKTYEELYTDNAEYEKEKRRLSVKKSWNEISDDKKNKRVINMRNAVRKNSKYSEDLIKEIKEKLKSGIKIKELSKDYPQMSYNYLYSIRNGDRWGDL